MHLKSALIFQVLTNYYRQSALEPLLKYLPSDEKESIVSEKTHVQDLSIIYKSHLNILDVVHYTWLEEPLKQFPENIKTYILSSLSENSFHKLNSLNNLGLTNPIKLPENLKRYFQNLLYQQLGYEENLPQSLLPSSHLSFLTGLSKKDLVELVDYLGIYDLANLIRQIIDKKKLKLINQCLTEERKEFVRKCLHAKDKVVLPLIELEPWDGDCKKLNQLIHQRGLLRLGKALSYEHKDLIWTIAHILDIGRGSILLKYAHQKAPQGVVTALLQQIDTTINFIKTKSS